MDAEIRTSLGDFTAEVTANGIGVDLPRYDRRVFLCSDQPSPPDYWARALNTTLSPPILTHSWASSLWIFSVDLSSERHLPCVLPGQERWINLKGLPVDDCGLSSIRAVTRSPVAQRLR